MAGLQNALSSVYRGVSPTVARCNASAKSAPCWYRPPNGQLVLHHHRFDRPVPCASDMAPGCSPSPLPFLCPLLALSRPLNASSDGPDGDVPLKAVPRWTQTSAWIPVPLKRGEDPRVPFSKKRQGHR